MKTTTDSVRQVLMNELGMTRESVREEMQKIVAAEAQKLMSSLVSSGQLERLVNEEFRKLASGRGYDRNAIERLCVDAAKKEVETFIRNNLRFDVPTAPSAVGEKGKV